MKVILEFMDLSQEQLHLMKNAEAILSELGFSMKRKYLPKERVRLWNLDQKYKNDKPVNVYIVQEENDNDITQYLNGNNLMEDNDRLPNNGDFNFRDEKDITNEVENNHVIEFSIRDYMNSSNESDFSEEMNENLNKLDIAVSNILNRIISDMQYEEEMEYNLQKEEFLNNISTLSVNDEIEKKDHIIKLLYNFIGDDDITTKIEQLLK